jgi:hypothetical protein
MNFPSRNGTGGEGFAGEVALSEDNIDGCARNC